MITPDTNPYLDAPKLLGVAPSATPIYESAPPCTPPLPNSSPVRRPSRRSCGSRSGSPSRAARLK